MGGKCDYNNSVEKFEQDSQSGPAPDRRINTMANCAIVGINWGDEGKGRMVDYLTEHYDVVVRYQGGGNAGHTVVNEKGKFALHLLPSGIFRDGVVNILGNGVALDCENLLKEMETLRAAGVIITPENLKVSDRASLLLPWHRELDALEEARLADKKYGSTKQGIAPFYGDKYQKKTVQAGELLHPEHLKEHLADLLEWKNLMLQKIYGAKGYTMDELMAWVNTYCGAIKPYITDTGRFLRNAQKEGKSILFISHKLKEVMEVCNRYTVLRDGKLVGEYEIEKLPRVQLVAKMLGKELDDEAQIKDETQVYHADENVPPVFEVEQLQSNAGIKPFDFYIRKGEVNGFTGLLGSGRSECVRAIFGADRIIGGKIKKNGKEIKITKPIDAMKNGIAYLPEDRKVDGIVGDLSVRDNIILAAQVLRGFFRPFSKAQANKFADEYIKLLEIKTASADTPIKSLSGGNQQKVILARWLLTHPEYLILDEPTRGIDIGTKIEIQKLVLKLASEGMSVTFISSETDEMLRTCSRLIVMRDRRKVGEISGEDLTQSKIMDTIAGGEKKNG